MKPRFPGPHVALAALLLGLFVAQCVWFVRTQSLTYDEPIHIAEGLDAWRNGRFQQYNDHPPLARLWFALPLLNPNWQIEVEPLPRGFVVHRISPDPISLAWRARMMNVFFGVALGVLLWLFVGELFSPVAASFVLALFAFSPSLIAHFSLATTDGIATLMIFATAYQVVRWRRKSGWGNAVLCGFVFGLLLLAKFSTLPMFSVALVWMLVIVRGRLSFRPLHWNWTKTAAALGVAFLVLWSGYFFHVSHVTIHNGTLTVIHPNWSAAYVKLTHTRVNLSVAIPAGEFIAGFRDVALHNAHGQPAFFLGKVSATGGWKSYYPVVMLLKWPLLVLALAIMGLILLVRYPKWKPEIWIVLSFPAIYFVLALFAHFNIGERHILPLYPFALVCAAALWEKAGSSRIAKLALVVCAILNACDALRSAPDYLSYFSIAVPRTGAVQFLSDSNLDWGQGLIAVRNYERQHPDEQLSLAYFGSVDPRVYGIHAQLLAEDQRTTGTMIVGATDLSGQYLDDSNAYRWLLAYKPELLDGSLYVFRVPGASQSKQAVH